MKPVADAVFPSNKKLSGWFSETAQKQPFSTSAWLEMHGTKEEVPSRADYHFISSKGKLGEIPPGVKYVFSTNMFFDKQFPQGRGLFYQLQVPGRDYYGTSDPIDLELLSLDSPSIPESDIPKNTNTLVENELIDPDIVQTESFHNYPLSQSIIPMIDLISIFSSPPSPHTEPDGEEIPTSMLLNSSSDTVASEISNSNPFYPLLSQQPLETLEDIFMTDDDISSDVQNVEIGPTTTLLCQQPYESIEDAFISAVSDSNLCLNESQITESSVKSISQLSNDIPLLPSQLPIRSLEDVINATVSDSDLNTSDIQNVETVPIPTLLSQQPYESIEDAFVSTVSDSNLCFNESQITESSVKSLTQLSNNIPLLPSQPPIRSLEDVINATVSDSDLNSSDIQNVEIVPMSVLSLQPYESIEDAFVSTVSDSNLCLNESHITESSVNSLSQLSNNIPLLPSQLPIRSLEDVINATVSDSDLNSSDIQNVVIKSQAPVSTQHLESLQDIFVNTLSDTEFTHGDDLNLRVVDSVPSPKLTQPSSPEFFTPDIFLPLVIDEEQFSSEGEAVNCPLQDESPLPPTFHTETITPDNTESLIRDEFSQNLFHETVSGDLETTLKYFSSNKLLFLKKFNLLPS